VPISPWPGETTKRPNGCWATFAAEAARADGRQDLAGWDAAASAWAALAQPQQEAYALLWAASGDARYAQKCAEILNAWSAVLTAHGMSNAPLQVGWTGGGFVRAAEILRYTYPQWDKAHVDQFSKMMNTAFLPKPFSSAACASCKIGL